MPVSISFGRSSMPLREVMKLTTGSAVELDRKPEDVVDIIVNNCVIARGEVVAIEGNYGVRITEIVSREQRMALRGSTRA
jgi:flagellar motor switch protein FliN/FliY